MRKSVSTQEIFALKKEVNSILPFLIRFCLNDQNDGRWKANVVDFFFSTLTCEVIDTLWELIKSPINVHITTNWTGRRRRILSAENLFMRSGNHFFCSTLRKMILYGYSKFCSKVNKKFSLFSSKKS